MVSSPPILFQFGCWLLAAIPCGFATELLEIKSKESSLHVLLLAGNPACTVILVWRFDWFWTSSTRSTSSTPSSAISVATHDIMAIVVHLDIIHRTMWGPFRKIVVMDARWSLHAIKVWGDLLNKNALRWVLAKENCSIIIGTMFRRFRRQECLESSDYTTIHFNPFHHNNHHFEPIQKALMAWNDRQFAVRFLEEQRRR
uniref:Uncharacterized protein n=1 Tax=Zea mays TaxID=4577 RepID=A0A804QKS0_MAIZE